MSLTVHRDPTGLLGCGKCSGKLLLPCLYPCISSGCDSPGLCVCFCILFLFLFFSRGSTFDTYGASPQPSRGHPAPPHNFGQFMLPSKSLKAAFSGPQGSSNFQETLIFAVLAAEKQKNCPKRFCHILPFPIHPCLSLCFSALRVMLGLASQALEGRAP